MMNSMKRIVNLEYFIEMLQISPRIPNQQFDELPFEEEISSQRTWSQWRDKDDYRCLHQQITLTIEGMYLKKNVDFAYLLWEDFVYQVEHKDAKKSNEIYYPRFTKVIVNFFMTKDQSIPRRNKVTWHYERDDHMFTTIKLVSRHQNTQPYGVILPIELTYKAIRNSKSYKEYYAIASGAEPPNTKASVRKKQSTSNTIVPPLTKGKRIKTSAKVDKPAKEKQPAKSSTAKGLNMLSEVALTEAKQINNDEDHEDQDDDDQDDHDDDDDQDEQDDDDDQDKDDDEQTNSNNDGDDFVHPKFSTHDEEVKDEESFDLIVQTPSHDDKTDDEDSDEDSDEMNVEGDEGVNEEDDADELYRDMNINLEGRDIQMADVQTNQVIEDTHVTLTPVNPEVDVSVSTTAEPPQLSATTLPLPTISIILHMQQTPAPSLENLEAEVLTRSSNSSKTSYAVAADLYELELKKILIEKMESNKSIHRSDQQKNLYKDLVDAYECDNLILDTYGDTVTLKRCRDDEDKDEEPSTGSNRGNLVKKADSRTSFNKLMDTPVDFSAFMMNRLKVDTLTPELLAGLTYELLKGSCKILVELEFFLEEVHKATTDQLDWNNTKRQQYPHDLLKPLPLIPNSRGSRVIPFDHFINNDLEYLCGGASSRKYTTSVTKTKAADYGYIKYIENLVPQTYGVKYRLAMTDILFRISRIGGANVNNYMDLRSIGNLLKMPTQNVESSDVDKLYKFKEGNFKRLRIQDIEDMLLLLVQGKLTNLTVDERFAFNVSLRMFTRTSSSNSIHTYAGNHVKDILLKLNLDDHRILKDRVAVTDDSPAIPEHITVETPMNMSLANKAHFEAEKEVMHLILTGIRDEIYSTVDACQTTQEMWEAIERLQQEVNELRAERLARNANPLALLLLLKLIKTHTTKHQSLTNHMHHNLNPQFQPEHKQLPDTKEKKIAKPITPSFETASKEDKDPKQAQRDKDIQKNLALIVKYFKKIYKPTNNNLRTSSNSKNKNVDMTPRYKDDNQFRQFGNQRMVNVVGARDNVGSPVVQQSGIQCFNCKELDILLKNAESRKGLKTPCITRRRCCYANKLSKVQNDAGYNVFANELQHSVQSESISNTCLVETDDSNVIPDSPDMCEDK
nr:hypothetical protein [Tanacetum cinerariifolium]